MPGCSGLLIGTSSTEETEALCRESLDCEYGEFTVLTETVLSDEEGIYVRLSWCRLAAGDAVS